MQNITILDYLLLPLFLAVFYWRVRKMSNSLESADLKKIIITAFALRMAGSVVYSMMVQYYYGYGDSFTYYYGSTFFNEQIRADFSNIYYLFAPFEETAEFYNSTSTDMLVRGYIDTPANNMVMKISGFLSLITFNKFLIISIFFGFYSFLGQWKLFKIFDELNNKKNRNLLALAVLYSPSIWFWSSGLLKDSICLGSVGFMIAILHKFFVRRKFSFFDLLALFFLAYIVTVIKSYISAIILIGLMSMLFMMFLNSIKSKIIKSGVFITVLLMVTILLNVSDFPTLMNDMAEDSIEQIQKFQDNYQMLQSEDENSKAGFGLGELEPTMTSLVLKSPAVIFTTLFRPFLWESRKIIILFTALESTLLLLCTLYVMFKIGFFTFFLCIIRTPHLLFCFVISMIFALIIGFTTFNFGTMIRYKVIFLPFYYFMLVNMYTLFVVPRKNVKMTVVENP